jgi:hypothetical protein
VLGSPDKDGSLTINFSLLDKHRLRHRLPKFRLGVLHAERRPPESGAFLFLDTPIDVDIAAELSAIAERVRRNIPHCRDPERFHTEKSCICQDLETLAEVFERPPGAPASKCTVIAYAKHQ